MFNSFYFLDYNEFNTRKEKTMLLLIKKNLNVKILIIYIQLYIFSAFPLSCHIYFDYFEELRNQRVFISLQNELCYKTQEMGHYLCRLQRQEANIESCPTSLTSLVAFFMHTALCFYAVTWQFFMNQEMLYARTFHYKKFQLRPDTAYINFFANKTIRTNCWQCGINQFVRLKKCFHP